MNFRVWETGSTGERSGRLNLAFVHARKFQEEIQHTIADDLLFRHPHVLSQIVGNHATQSASKSATRPKLMTWYTE